MSVNLTQSQPGCNFWNNTEASNLNELKEQPEKNLNPDLEESNVSLYLKDSDVNFVNKSDELDICENIEVESCNTESANESVQEDSVSKDQYPSPEEITFPPDFYKKRKPDTPIRISYSRMHTPLYPLRSIEAFKTKIRRVRRKLF